MLYKPTHITTSPECFATALSSNIFSECVLDRKVVDNRRECMCVHVPDLSIYGKELWCLEKFAIHSKGDIQMKLADFDPQVQQYFIELTDALLLQLVVFKLLPSDSSPNTRECFVVFFSGAKFSAHLMASM